MESLKPKVHAVQVCQSALRIPEEVVTSLPICHSALQLQEEASRLQHTAIQQCNIMQASITLSCVLLRVTWKMPYKFQWKQKLSYLCPFLFSHVISLRYSPLCFSHFWLHVFGTCFCLIYLSDSSQFFPLSCCLMLPGVTRKTANLQLYEGWFYN